MNGLFNWFKKDKKSDSSIDKMSTKSYESPTFVNDNNSITKPITIDQSEPTLFDDMVIRSDNDKSDYESDWSTESNEESNEDNWTTDSDQKQFNIDSPEFTIPIPPPQPSPPMP